MKPRRVVVTGLGCLSPLGNTTRATWAKLLDANSGIDRITRFDASPIRSQIAGEVKGFNPDLYIGHKDQKKLDIFTQYAIAAAGEAIADAHLEINDSNRERVGCAIGSGIGGISIYEQGKYAYDHKGPSRVSPFLVPGTIANMASGAVSIRFGLQGACLSLVTACASGAHNIGIAARMIQWGDADIMVAGGAEMATTPVVVSSFSAARAVSTRNAFPQQASRPFDKDRDGFVIGEGAGVVVLETYEQAKARGAKIYAEIMGFGMSGDAYHMTQPSENGDGGRRCMQHALLNAKILPQEIDYLNAHGTSTPQGDVAETRAIKTVFSDHAYKLAVSSTKSMTGHLLGAAGGVEAIFTILSIFEQVVPPTINLDTPDPECDLDYVPHCAREMKVNYAMSNSFGFGGTNASLIFAKC